MFDSASFLCKMCGTIFYFTWMFWIWCQFILLLGGIAEIINGATDVTVAWSVCLYLCHRAKAVGRNEIPLDRDTFCSQLVTFCWTGKREIWG